MWEILEVLRRVHRGEPYAAIQRATGHTRKTVRRYVAEIDFGRLGLVVDPEPSDASPRP
jgi:uncharacterized protein YerC